MRLSILSTASDTLGGTRPAQPLSRATWIVIFYGLMALAALGLAALFGMPRPDFIPVPSRLIAAPLAGLTAGLAVIAFCRYGETRWAWMRHLHREFHAIFYQFSAGEILLLAFASSVGEELLFRGVLQAKLGIIVSNLIFSSLHVRLERKMLPWTAMSFVVGLGFSGLYVAFDSLAAPIACHFIINLVNLHHTRRALVA